MWLKAQGERNGQRERHATMVIIYRHGKKGASSGIAQPRSNGRPSARCASLPGATALAAVVPPKQQGHAC